VSSVQHFRFRERAKRIDERAGELVKFAARWAEDRRSPKIPLARTDYALVGNIPALVERE